VPEMGGEMSIGGGHTVDTIDSVRRQIFENNSEIVAIGVPGLDDILSQVESVPNSEDSRESVLAKSLEVRNNTEVSANEISVVRDDEETVYTVEGLSYDNNITIDFQAEELEDQSNFEKGAKLLGEQVLNQEQMSLLFETLREKYPLLGVDMKSVKINGVGETEGAVMSINGVIYLTITAGFISTPIQVSFDTSSQVDENGSEISIAEKISNEIATALENPQTYRRYY
jgi:hypothetical protein